MIKIQTQQLIPIIEKIIKRQKIDILEKDGISINKAYKGYLPKFALGIREDYLSTIKHFNRTDLNTEIEPSKILDIIKLTISKYLQKNPSMRDFYQHGNDIEKAIEYNDILIRYIRLIFNILDAAKLVIRTYHQFDPNDAREKESDE